jgi:hypothetical protein
MRCEGIFVRLADPTRGETPCTFAVICQHCCEVTQPEDVYGLEFVPLSNHATVDEAETSATDHWLTHHFIKSLDWPGIVTEVRSRQSNVEDLLGADD